MSVERKSLFIFMHDHPAKLEDDSNRFYDFDHIPDRLSCEGWRGAERFALTDVEPAGWNPTQQWTKYLYFHFLDSLDALTSPARKSYDRGSPWARAQRADNRSTGMVSPSRGLRTGWTQRDSPWLGAISYRMPPPRVLFLVLRDVEPVHAAEVNAYIDEELVPELLGCPGFLHCERYEAGAPLTHAAGSENIVQPRYMDVYDVATPEVLSSDAYRLQQSSRSDRGRDLEQWVTVRGSGVYLQRPSPWLIEASNLRP
jgi:hypothetical protein